MDATERGSGEYVESTEAEDLGWTPTSLLPSTDLRSVIDEVEVEYAYDGDYLDWSDIVVGINYRAIFDETGSIDISSNRDPESVIVRVEVPKNQDRYIGGLIFQEDFVYLVDGWKGGSEGVDIQPELNRFLRIDLITGGEAEVSPPDGHHWRSFADDAVAIGDVIVKGTDRADGSGSCLVQVDGTTSSELACFDGKFLNFFDAATDGVSAQLFNWDENIIDCRERVWVSFDGTQQELIGEDDSCYPFDGTRIDEWDIWGRTPEAPGHLRYSYGRVREVDGGDERQFGMVRTGTMRFCGSSVYWVGFEPDELGQDYGAQFIARWRPEDEQITKIHSSQGQYTLVLGQCSEGVMNAMATPVRDLEWQRNFYWKDSE